MRAGFVRPDFTSPIDVEAHLRHVPEAATIKGMFPIALLAEAERRGVSIAPAHTRFLPFKDYPLREHCRLLVAAAHAFFPDRPTREGLRRVGWDAPHAFARSTVGKVVFSLSEGTSGLVRAAARAIGMSMHVGEARVIEEAAHASVVELVDCWQFADCHFVGVFEGVLRFAGVSGAVFVRALGPAHVELALEWQA